MGCRVAGLTRHESCEEPLRGRALSDGEVLGAIPPRAAGSRLRGTSAAESAIADVAHRRGQADSAHSRGSVRYSWGVRNGFSALPVDGNIESGRRPNEEQQNT